MADRRIKLYVLVVATYLHLALSCINIVMAAVYFVERSTLGIVVSICMALYSVVMWAICILAQSIFGERPTNG